MKTTIDMAREAGFETMLRKGKILGFDRDGDYTEELKAFEALVRADEREACAKVCEELAEKEWADNERCAAAIRNRGNT
jgi:nicotinamidase-related amidase